MEPFLNFTTEDGGISNPRKVQGIISVLQTILNLNTLHMSVWNVFFGKITWEIGHFIYFTTLSSKWVCLCTDHTTPRSGVHSPFTLDPPPSAGQTLTLGQMDNGLFALSPSDHSLSPALSVASHFTSFCPCFSLPPSSLSCSNYLNQQNPLLPSPALHFPFPWHLPPPHSGCLFPEQPPKRRCSSSNPAFYQHICSALLTRFGLITVYEKTGKRMEQYRKMWQPSDSLKLLIKQSSLLIFTTSVFNVVAVVVLQEFHLLRCWNNLQEFSLDQIIRLWLEVHYSQGESLNYLKIEYQIM